MTPGQELVLSWLRNTVGKNLSEVLRISHYDMSELLEIIDSQEAEIARLNSELNYDFAKSFGANKRLEEKKD